MRQLVAWCVTHYPRIRRAAIRLGTFVGGILILHREVYEVSTPEPLLVFLGLWLCGVAPAQFFDGLKKVGQGAMSSLEDASTHLPHDDDKPDSKLKSVEDSTPPSPREDGE